MNDITALAQRMLLDFTKPLETESGDPVKYICHDVIEYKCARVCVDAATGTVYSSPYVGLKIRNTSQYAVLRKFTEEAASAYSDFENGYISDMKCGDRSHEYLMFVKEPANVLALVEALEKAQRANAAQDDHINQQQDRIDTLERRNAELGKYAGELESLTVTVKRVGADQMHRVCLEATRHLDKYAAMAREVNKLLGSAVTNTTAAQPVTVKLPKRSVGEVMHMSGFSRDYAEGWCSGNDNAINEMKLAGIQVIEGEG